MEPLDQGFCISADKELMLRMLRLNNVKVIELADPVTSRYPLIGRKYGQHGGTDVSVVQTKEQGLDEGYDYFTKLYVIEQEYRFEVKELTVEKVFMAIPESVVSGEIPVRTSSNGWQWKEMNSDLVPEDWMALAIRAAYIIGLSHAYVKIGKLLNDNPIVIDINPLAHEASKPQTSARNEHFTIGADVEFMLSCDGELLPASEFFPLEGSVGCDERQIEQDSGEYALVEMRPSHSDTPHGLFSNIQTLIAEASEKTPYENIAFRAGSMPFFGYQCGGHIHFGLEPSLSRLRALDYYLAIPLAMIEESNPSRRRRRTKHGGLGRIRMKPYGFEYISLSSWIISPEIALATLCLAHLLVSEHESLDTPYLYSPSTQEAYYKGNQQILRLLWNDMKKRLLQLDKYPSYEKDLAPLFATIENGQTLEGHTDIRKSWGHNTPKKSYDRGHIIYIPKKTREKLHLKVEQESYICAGKSISKARIKPYPFSFRNPNVIQLSPALREALSLPKDWIPKVSTSSGALILGPIMGILAERPFDRQATYFQHLCKIAKQKQMLVYVFEPNDIIWDKQLIKGTTMEGEGIFPFPAVIYDRHFRINNKQKKEIDETRSKLQYIYDIPFLNPPSLFDLTGDKWAAHELLSQHFSEYLPETRLLEKPSDLVEMINLYGEIFIKPIGGAMSKGILRVVQKPEGLFWMNEKQRVFQPLKGMSELESFFFPLKKNKKYIIQEAIKRRKLGNYYVELRSYMQKNAKSNWVKTGMVCRMTKEGVMSEDTEVNRRSSQVMKKLFANAADMRAMKVKIDEVVKKMAHVIEKEVGAFGELAIDICIDQSNSIKILEINAKPDNLFSQVKAYKLRNLAAIRLLNYAASLSGYELDKASLNEGEEE